MPVNVYLHDISVTPWMMQAGCTYRLTDVHMMEWNIRLDIACVTRV